MIVFQKKTRSTFFCVLAACLLAGMLPPRTAATAQAAENAPEHDLLSLIAEGWGGHVRAIGTVSRVGENSIYRFADDGPYTDGQAEWRLKNRLDFGSRWSLDTHYELVALGGDTRENTQAVLQDISPPLTGYISLLQPINDDQRLLDLTHVLSETDRYIVYHRLDRLNLTWTPDWGTLRLGRQALTWGDGLVFNPMDLFNPFSPTAVQRDYKIGDDMALFQLPVGRAEMQMLYLPRRDPQTGDIEEDTSSYAVKYHAFVGSMEMDAMAARHYDDAVGGLGASGYLGEAAWRINAVYTNPAGQSREDDFFQVVANVDYAWTWGGKNVYGFLEFYYNGLGSTGDYAATLTNRDLVERLARGEMFTIGRYYLSGEVQVELHPLVQLYTTLIVNLSDPSEVLQPQVMWDMLENFQIIAGAQWHWGPDGSEFGGFDISADGITIDTAPADQVYCWLTYYF